MYGGGNADCSGHGAGVPDSGVCLVEAEGGGEETRTLSAKDSARLFAEGAGFSAAGAGVDGAGVANGLLPAGVGPELEEKGLEFVEMLLVRLAAPNKLAPRSCLGCSGTLGCDFSSVLGSSSFFGGLPIATLRVARNALILPGLRLQGFLGQPNRYRRRSSVGK